MAGHCSLDRTIKKIQADYWFPKMKRYVRYHINRCLDCLIFKKPGGKKPGLLHPIPPGQRPFATIHIDHLGPLETTSKGNRYILVIVDNLTKYVHLYTAKTTDTRGVIRSLSEFIEQRGNPDRIISDRGTCFTAKTFQEFCLDRGIDHILNSSRHPQGNGQVERVNRTLIPV